MLFIGRYIMPGNSIDIYSRPRRDGRGCGLSSGGGLGSCGLGGGSHHRGIRVAT